ncbi:MAG: hypothetical protein WC802_02135 [Patescibacteria group bacterium]|jgi:hypothetical protein
MAIERKIQLGVMGSCADLQYSNQIQMLAEKIGEEIAKAGAVLLFGAEKDLDSLSSAACRGAKRNGGLALGITYGATIDGVIEKNADAIITAGMGRGGGREFVLVSSCDAIICVNGGSGTLTEIAIAYQANIPIIALKNTGGWSERLAGSFIDQRERVRVEIAETPADAVTMAIKAVYAKHTIPSL